MFSWLAEKLFKGRRESAEAHTQRVWEEWDTRRMAAEEAGAPFDEPQPEQVKSGRSRRRRGRRGGLSPEEAAAAGVAGGFLVGPHVDHGHGHHSHGGFDGGFHGGDAGGGGF